MKVALVYLDALAGGGYPKDVRWLAGALADTGTVVEVVTNDGPHRDGLGAAVAVGPGRFRSTSDEYDVVHLWGIFSPEQFFLCRRRWGKHRFVITPAGHLMTSHLRRRWWKKLPYLVAMQPILVRNRHVAHFFSEAEANDGGRRFLHGAARFEASLGLFPAPADSNVGATASDDYLLFFGRNDIYQKGMDQLLAGYGMAVARGLRLPLVIAGQPHDGSDRLLPRMITDLGLTRRVELLGEVSEERKWELLRGARSLAFLSRWDGPPRPIREAIAAGTPTVVSRGTNMASLIRDAGAGLAVGTGKDEVADGLLEAQDQESVLSWRAGAVALQSKLSWQAVADRYRAGYELTVSRVA